MHPSTSTVLVTGGCGYIGRQLCLQLLALGHHLVVVDDLSSGLHPDIWLKDAIAERRAEGTRIVYRLGHKPGLQPLTLTLLQVDLRRGLGPTMSQEAWPTWAAVYHLAGPTVFAAQLTREPLRVGVKMAIDGSFFAWAEAHKAQMHRLVYLSPRDLDQPTSAVAAAADAGEALARMAASRCGIATANVRMGGLYGKDQDGQAWLPALAQQVLRAGDTLGLAPGAAQARHVLHIDDAVQALLLAAEHLRDGEPVALANPAQVTPGYAAGVLGRLRQRPLVVQPAAVAAPAPAAQNQDVARGWAAVRFAPRTPFDAALSQVMRSAQRREQQQMSQAPASMAQPPGA